jgi:thioredoxin reductase (NADPH)
VEEGYYLSTFAKSVTVVQNLDRLTAEAKANEKLIQQPNVKVYYETLVDKFLKDDKGLTGATLKDKDGKTFDVFADGVFEYVGMIPVTDFVKHLGITTNYGYITVNEKMETKIPGILSCGDVNDKQIRQVVTAAGDGAVAAQNALKYLESLH